MLMLTLVISPVAHAADDDKKASDQFMENADAKKKGSMADTLVVMSASAMGAGAITSCTGPGRISPSSIAFIAGSVIYLMGEISSGKAQKESIKKRADDLRMTKEKMTVGGDVQKMALEEALKEQEETLKFIRKRKGFMTAVNVAWIAAAGLAILENFPLLIPLNTQACPALQVSSVPWILAIEGAWMAAIGFSSGQPLAAMLTPIALGVALTFIPGLTLPVTRAVLFSAAAVFALKAAGELGEKEGVIEKNISMLKEALGQFENETGQTTTAGSLAGTTSGSESGSSNTQEVAGAGTLGSSEVANQAVASGNASAADASVTDKTCATSAGTKVTVGSDCTKPVSLSFSKPSVDIPSLQVAAQTAVQAANSLAAGNAGAAEISAASLANMAANVEAGKKTALNLLNNRLAKEGKPKLDLDGETKKSVESMTASMLASIDKGGAPLMAALGGLGSSPAVIAPVKVEAASEPVEPSVLATSVAPAVSAPVTEAATAKDLTVAQVDEKKDSLENYEVETSDISRNKDATIWQQVTNRYQNNYGKFFERKKVQTVP